MSTATDVARARLRALQPEETAWAALLPCALVTFVALLAIGPLVGHALFEPSAGEVLWPQGLPSTRGQPEPVKRGRFVVALLGPALLAAAVYVNARRPLRLPPVAIRALVIAGQLGLLAFVVVAVLGQNNVLLPYSIEQLWPIFGVGTLIVALLLALTLLAAARSDAVVQRVRRAARETRALRVACLLVAIALPVAWLLTGIVTERSIGDTQVVVWTMNDPFAVLDGRTPLVDYRAFYAQLTPYLGAGALWAFGETVLTFAVTMTSLSLLALLAIYALLRRVLGGRSLLALALYAPFVALGFLAIDTYPVPSAHPLGNATLYAIWPMRYGGAYVVAWLAARHLDGSAPRRAWLLFLAAGLVALDNLEFGATAFVATLVAVLCARASWTRAELRALALQVAGGVLGALAVVAAITLVRTGSLPHLQLLLEWPRVFGVLGLVAQPMPRLGFHLVVFATYVAAVVVAVVRRVRAEPSTLLTGMLAWSGVFGLLSAGYYLGRSDTAKLVALFSAWALALVLLTVVVLRQQAASERRWPTLAELLVLVGFGLAICSLRGLPAPGPELARLREDRAPAQYLPGAESFVKAATKPGEKVTILIPLGHRIAHDLGLVNVSPYPFIETVVTRRQLDVTIAAARAEGARQLFLPEALIAPAHHEALRAAGFVQGTTDENFSVWNDG